MVQLLRQAFQFGHQKNEGNIDPRLKWDLSCFCIFYESKTLLYLTYYSKILTNLRVFFFHLTNVTELNTYVDLFKPNKNINWISFTTLQIERRKKLGVEDTQTKWWCSQCAQLWHIVITLLEDKKLIPSATCQANFMSCCDVRLVFGLTSGSL